MIKMVASSFYNTLIDKEDAISMSTMLEIDRIRKRNIKFTILTNRSYHELDYYNHDFPFIDYIVSFNGNLVLDLSANKIIYNNPLSEDIIEKIISQYPNRNILLYSEEDVYTKENYHNKTIYKIEVELAKKDIANLKEEDNIFKYNKKYYLEITSDNTYQGLFELIQKTNIKKNDLLLIIGNESEKKLIKEIPNTYIIGNSPKKLKVTNKKTSSNNFKGVEKIIKKQIK